MSLRHAELLQVASELNQRLAGGSINKAWSPVKGVAYLDVRHQLLCLSAEPEVARLSVVAARLPSGSAASSFQKWLRQELVGGRLASIEVHARDRVVRVSVETAKGPRALVGELLPRGELLLLGEDDRVLAHSAPAQPREGIAVGQPWSAPPDSLSDEARQLASRLGDGASFAAAAEALFADRERARRVDAVRRALVQPLRTKRDRLARTLEKVRAEAGRAPEAERMRRLGELVSFNLHAIAKGQREARLTEYTEEGPREVVVELDPARSPKEQADRYFHQYKRMLRGSEAAARRAQALEEELKDAEAALQRAVALDDSALMERTDVLAEVAARRPEQARPYREYSASSGARIWVGKSAEGNDELTFRSARPHDLWLHARGVPGAHVVIPLERRAELPQEVLLDAAHLALHHSQLKGEPRGEVSYTPVKFVRRVKDGAPGQVTYTREKTFVLRLEPERLERLLRSGTE